MWPHSLLYDLKGLCVLIGVFIIGHMWAEHESFLWICLSVQQSLWSSILHLNSIVEIEGSYWSISNLELKSFHLIITYSFIDYYCNFVITVGGEKTTRWA